MPKELLGYLPTDCLPPDQNIDDLFIEEKEGQIYMVLKSSDEAVKAARAAAHKYCANYLNSIGMHEAADALLGKIGIVQPIDMDKTVVDLAIIPSTQSPVPVVTIRPRKRTPK